MGFWLLLAVQPTKSQSFKRVADIFEEIDEELKQDQFYGWWKKYGKIIIVVVSILILATGAFYWWDSYQKKQIEGQASALTAAVALVSESKNDEAKLAFEALIADGGTYGMLAGFEQAKLALSTGDKEAAIEALDTIVDNSSADEQYRDRAKLLSLMQQIGDADTTTLVSGFEGLASPTGTYRYTAREMIGVVKAQSGDIEGAKTDLAELIEIEGVPSTLVRRVEEYLKTLD